MIKVRCITKKWDFCETRLVFPPQVLCICVCVSVCEDAFVRPAPSDLHAEHSIPLWHRRSAPRWTSAGLSDGQWKTHISQHTHTGATIGWLAAMTDGGVRFTWVTMETSISFTLSSCILSNRAATACRGVQRGPFKPSAGSRRTYNCCGARQGYQVHKSPPWFKAEEHQDDRHLWLAIVLLGKCIRHLNFMKEPQ